MDILACNTHSQKELAQLAVDVTVEFYACLFSSSLMCNLLCVFIKTLTFFCAWNLLSCYVYSPVCWYLLRVPLDEGDVYAINSGFIMYQQCNPACHTSASLTVKVIPSRPLLIMSPIIVTTSTQTLHQGCAISCIPIIRKAQFIVDPAGEQESIKMNITLKKLH